MRPCHSSPQQLSSRRILFVVFFLQIGGLALVLGFAPFAIIQAIQTVSPISVSAQQSNTDLVILSFILFSVLALFNTIAVFSIWRMRRWVQRFFLIKLGVVALLILSVFVLVRDYPLLFVYVPLFCSLVFLVWGYSRVLKTATIVR